MNNQTFMIDAFDMWEETNIKVINNKTIDYTANLSECGDHDIFGTFIDAIIHCICNYIILITLMTGINLQENLTYEKKPQCLMFWQTMCTAMKISLIKQMVVIQQ